MKKVENVLIEVDHGHGDVVIQGPGWLGDELRPLIETANNTALNKGEPFDLRVRRVIAACLVRLGDHGFSFAPVPNTTRNATTFMAFTREVE